MKKSDRIFNETYKIDEATNLHMIEVAIDQHSDIFNEWDAAPFKRRDLDPDLQLYLETNSNEITAKYNVELCFTLPAGRRDEPLEEESRNGIKNSFISKRYFLSKDIKKTNTRMVWFVLVGLLCLWVAKVLSGRVSEADLPSILLEGLAISGWVFLWEAVSLFFFTNRELYDRYKTYKRLQNAPVIFREAENSAL
ncbi:hypothetical protein AB3R30_10845 [Leptolyngbyaceae cyanobacterium UHCC 1019]